MPPRSENKGGKKTPKKGTPPTTAEDVPFPPSAGEAVHHGPYNSIPNPPPPIPEVDTKAWAGPSLDLLRQLEQYLCVVRNRTDLFGGRDEQVLKHGASGMAGLLVGKAYQFLKDAGVRLPSKTKLHEPLGRNSYGPIGNMLGGDPGPGDVWTKEARVLLKFLCLGSVTPHDAKTNVHARIDDYFFRNFTTGKTPPAMFDKWRRWHSEPCSASEFAGEVRWYARQKEMAPASDVRLVWVLGLTPFRTHSNHNEPTYGNSVVDAIAAKVAVKFVYCDDRHPNNGIPGTTPLPSESLAGFLQYFLPGQRTPFTQVSLNDSHDPGWWGFVVPVFQYVYLQADGDETLYILRGEEGDLKEEDRGPIAHRAHKSELAVFKKWLEAIDAIK